MVMCAVNVIGRLKVTQEACCRFELGRQPAMTKLSSNVTVRRVRVRGGNSKFRALRLDAGNFSWGSEVRAAPAVCRSDSTSHATPSCYMDRVCLCQSLLQCKVLCLLHVASIRKYGVAKYCMTVLCLLRSCMSLTVMPSPCRPPPGRPVSWMLCTMLPTMSW